MSNSVNLKKKVVIAFSGQLINGDVKLASGGTNFILTDLALTDCIICKSVNGALVGGCKTVKTLEAVQEFVALHS